VDAPPDDVVDIPRAAKPTNCGAIEVVCLSFDRKLGRVGRRVEMEGYFSVRVKAEEVKPLVRGHASDDLSLKDVERTTTTSFLS